MAEPARGYRWPDAQPGNLLGVKSGAWSPRLVSQTMEELRPQLQAIIDLAPWCRPVDELALTDMLRDMARAERLEVWLAEHGDRYPEGHERAGELRDRDLRELGALRNRLLAHRSRLGLDPASRARMDLSRTLGPDVAQAMAALAAATAEAAATEEDDGGQ